MNICTNAAQAMQDQGGVLTIGLEDSTSREGKEQVRLWVQDTGVGIPTEIVERIFDPFFTTKEQGEGTGMGLAVVHGIVKSHGGSIEVASTTGRGTRFDVYLPSIACGMNADATANHNLPRGTERILIVDDELALIEMAAQGLRRLGYQVESRASSVEALELYRLKADRFDLVITDLTMPHMTGIQLAGEMIRIRENIPIILCTGFSEQSSDDRLKAAGIRAKLAKPVITRALAETIREVLNAVNSDL
jgi:CheY-like chemotaxis protein